MKEYSTGCLIPRADDVMITWADVKNHTVAKQLLEQTFSDTCTGQFPIYSVSNSGLFYKKFQIKQSVFGTVAHCPWSGNLEELLQNYILKAIRGHSHVI